MMLKKTMNKQIQSMKTQLVQSKKNLKNTKNEVHFMKQKVVDANDALSKKKAKVDETARQVATIRRNVADNQQRIDQI